MNAVILVPYRPGDRHRDRVWQYVRHRHEAAGYRIVTADSDGDWCRARALNAAARAAGGWDVAFVSDADKTGLYASQITEAAERAYRTGRYVVGRDRLVHIDRRRTLAILDGVLPIEGMARLRSVLTWDGWFAIRRDRWDELGGMDERISGYGGQGVAFAAAAGTLFGRDVVEGPVFHLWHPPVGKRREMIDRNASLVRRYTAADDDPVVMRRVLARPRRYRWR